MSALIPFPISPAPGVVVTESQRVAEGRWIPPFDKIRFVKGKAQKIGGNNRLTSSPMSGTPRATHAWRDFLQNQYVAAGTYRKLYAFDSGYTINDITPFSSTGTLGATRSPRSTAPKSSPSPTPPTAATSAIPKSLPVRQHSTT
jgi:Flp pilus assembly protein TadG